MRNLILLLFISQITFSQVYEEDTSFEFSGVSKLVASPKVSTINLPGGKVIFSHTGTYINDSLKLATFIWDPGTKKIEPFGILKDNFIELYSSQLSNTGDFLFYKSHSYSDNGVSESTLYKVDFEGNRIDGFDIKEEGFLYSFMELADGKLLTRFGDGTYKIFSASGKFEGLFSLSASGFGNDTFLNDAVFLDGHYYFLLVQNDSGKLIVKRTDKFLANAQNLELPTFDSGSAPNNKLFKIGKKIYVYTSSLDDQENHLFEFDTDGNQTRDVTFGKVGNFMSSLPNIFWSDAGAITLKYADNDWIKINSNGSHKIYPKELGIINFQKNDLFLTRDGLETFETDLVSNERRKIALKFAQKLDFKPEKTFAIKNGLRLVEFSEMVLTPFQYTYLSPARNVLQLFDKKGEVLQEFFDNETHWNWSTQGDLVLVKGGSKIYILDDDDVLSEYENRWKEEAQFDIQNKSVYYTRYLYEDYVNYYEVVKESLEGTSDPNFYFKSNQGFASLQFLPETYELALFPRSVESNIRLLNADSGDIVRTMIVDQKLIMTGGTYKLIPTLTNDMYLRKTFLRQSYPGNLAFNLSKVYEQGASEEYVAKSEMDGGVSYIVLQDGSLVFSSIKLSQEYSSMFYRSLKMLPNGEVDGDFLILSKEPIVQLSKQNEDTFFATSSSGLHRYVKNVNKKAPYLYVESELESNITWSQVKPNYFKVHSSDSLYTLKLSDNVKLANDSLYVDPKLGYASVVIKNRNGYFSFRYNIFINKEEPEFSKHFSEIYALQGPTWLRFSSSSGEPVYIKSGDSQPEYRDSILVDPNGSWNRINLYLRVAENELYSSAQENLVLDVLSPLASEENLKEALPYPNPSSGTFLLPLKAENISEMKLTNMQGQQLSFTCETIDKGLKLYVSHYTPGVHILSLTERNKILVFKLILE